MRFPLLLIALLLGLSMSAQFIDNGPIVGGVQSGQARIYLRTSFLQSFTLEVDTDPGFSNPLQFSDSTRADLYNAAVVTATGLQPSTQYHYRFLFGGQPDTLQGKFRTFPAPGQAAHTKIVVGSCNYGYQNDVLFESIRTWDPDLFIHLGDWNYPPSTYGWDYNLYPDKVAQSFALRYSDYNMASYVLRNMPVDYMYDDAYCHNGNAGWSVPRINQVTLPGGEIKYDLVCDPLPSGIRAGAIKGYFDYFPGYAAVDTSAGVHHSFRIGDIEFFILDTRNSKDCEHDAFTYDSGSNTWSFTPPAGHTTLGASQRQWLLDGLRNSTASWKVIGSSVVFNQRQRELLDFLIISQLVDPGNIEYASALAYMWAGFPEDIDSLMHTIESEGIENVVMISGDTHASMMDDGFNSGIPELSSSGLAAGGEGVVNWTIDSIAQANNSPFDVRDSLWNGGGNGIDNQNFNDTYATMEFFGADSVQWCIIDEMDQVISCMTLYNSSLSTDREAAWTQPQASLHLLYPNPAKDKLQLRYAPEFQPSKDASARITDLQGRILREYDAQVLRQPVPEISLEGLAEGWYLFHFSSGGEQISRKFMKHGAMEEH